jgi:hypothetical protein
MEWHFFHSISSGKHNQNVGYFYTFVTQDAWACSVIRKMAQLRLDLNQDLWIWYDFPHEVFIIQEFAKHSNLILSSVTVGSLFLHFVVWNYGRQCCIASAFQIAIVECIPLQCFMSHVLLFCLFLDKSIWLKWNKLCSPPIIGSPHSWGWEKFSTFGRSCSSTFGR